MDTSVVARLATQFLVVATGENSAASIPPIPGLSRFEGEAIHSSAYKSGRAYTGKSVLVVGAGNSGMEIAYDLATHGAHTSIVVRSPVCTTYLFILHYTPLCVQTYICFLFIVQAMMEYINSIIDS